MEEEYLQERQVVRSIIKIYVCRLIVHTIILFVIFCMLFSHKLLITLAHS